MLLGGAGGDVGGAFVRRCCTVTCTVGLDAPRFVAKESDRFDRVSCMTHGSGAVTVLSA